MMFQPPHSCFLPIHKSFQLHLSNFVIKIGNCPQACITKTLVKQQASIVLEYIKNAIKH